MMTTYSKKEIRAYLRKELKEYERTIGELTACERKGLHEWVNEGNSIADNPFYYYEEEGHPMDYISAIRVNEEIMAHPELFEFTGPADTGDSGSGDEPF